MHITLRPVDRDNWLTCARLQIYPHQESFVAPNVYSLAQALVEPEDQPLVIYAGDTVVGFLMYERSQDDGNYWLFRFMIDGEHQGKGYGRDAMQELISRLSIQPDCDSIWLTVNPANTSAEQLYSSLGFARTGTTDDHGEPIMCLRLERATDDDADREQG